MITKGEENRYKFDVDVDHVIKAKQRGEVNEHNETIKASTNDFGQSKISGWLSSRRSTYLLDNLVFPSLPRPASFRQR